MGKELSACEKCKITSFSTIDFEKCPLCHTELRQYLSYREKGYWVEETKFNQAQKTRTQ